MAGTLRSRQESEIAHKITARSERFSHGRSKAFRETDTDTSAANCVPNRDTAQKPRKVERQPERGPAELIERRSGVWMNHCHLDESRIRDATEEKSALNNPSCTYQYSAPLGRNSLFDPGRGAGILFILTFCLATPAGSPGPRAPGKEIPWLEPLTARDKTPATLRGPGAPGNQILQPSRNTAI
jgi:hypothetical protein